MPSSNQPLLQGATYNQSNAQTYSSSNSPQPREIPTQSGQIKNSFTVTHTKKMDNTPNQQPMMTHSTTNNQPTTMQANRTVTNSDITQHQPITQAVPTTQPSQLHNRATSYNQAPSQNRTHNSNRQPKNQTSRSNTTTTLSNSTSSQSATHNLNHQQLTWTHDLPPDPTYNSRDTQPGLYVCGVKVCLRNYPYT